MSIAHPPTPSSTCRNCGAPIHKPGTEYWIHDGIGTRRCDGTDRPEAIGETETAQPDPFDALGGLGGLVR
ncbi:MAG: hypothetical protein ACRDV9_07290 [Acidimicrobiia bacterium]